MSSLFHYIPNYLDLVGYEFSCIEYLTKTCSHTHTQNLFFFLFPRSHPGCKLSIALAAFLLSFFFLRFEIFKYGVFVVKSPFAWFSTTCVRTLMSEYWLSLSTYQMFHLITGFHGCVYFNGLDHTNNNTGTIGQRNKSKKGLLTYLLTVYF